MQHLRLVGVHEDGSHLLLTDDDGNRYALPLDESLRAAARRDRPRLGQLQIEISGELRPRDVQAMIRAGMSADEVAARAGWPVEKVHRYEVPILAEREHIAGLARQVRLRARGVSHGGAPTLDARVAERLRSREIDLSTVRWDSRRAEKGAWTVLLGFTAGGRLREAAWQFDPLSRTVSALDDEARWLSEDEEQETPGPIPAPHLAATNRAGRVFDVEAEVGLEAAARRPDGDTVDLMAAMRERSTQRGRRRRPRANEAPGLDHSPEEALPLEELAGDPRRELPPPAHTHPEDDPEITRHGRTEDRVGAEAAARRARRAERTQPVGHPDPEVAADDPSSGPESDDDARGATRERAGDARRSPGRAADGTAGSARSARSTGSGRARGASGPVAEPAEAEAETIVDVDVDVDTDLDTDLETDIDTDLDADELIEERSRPTARRTSPAAKPAPPRRPASTRKSGRPSVPSWDDIMFGRRSD